MGSIGRIITIGLSPAWDMSCRGRDLEWGQHATIDEQVVRPAGKALNVSTALAWMGCPSIAAGLWGRDDYDAMHTAVESMRGLIDLQMTAVPGRTRHNITVVDTSQSREMHLRLKSTLTSEESLARLRADLQKLVRQGDLCVFAGAMPAGPLLEPVVDLVRLCHGLGARIVLDSYGPVLEHTVAAGLPWLMAPNVEELSGLLGRNLPDTSANLASAARGLLAKVPMVLVSRGKNGAILVTEKGFWKARARTEGTVLSTVGCGDYLLAGFLAAQAAGKEAPDALSVAIQAATARAWGRTEADPWPRILQSVEVAVEPMSSF